MNALERWIDETGVSEVETMDRLADAGIISDECVEARDVDAVDAKRAVKWLEETR